MKKNKLPAYHVNIDIMEKELTIDGKKVTLYSAVAWSTQNDKPISELFTTKESAMEEVKKLL